MRKKIQLSFFFIGLCFHAAGFSGLEEGEKLLMDNKPREALPLLLEALDTDPENETIYLYLGILYEQLDQPEKSLTLLKRGLPYAREFEYLFYFNMGNSLTRQGDNILAEEMFSQALSQRREFPEPYLNRGNSRLILGNYEGALNDYTIYLRLAPDSGQRDSVQKMINALRNRLAVLEQQEREIKEREQALMNQVLNSLRNASEDSQNLSSGTDKVLEVDEEEIDIED